MERIRNTWPVWFAVLLCAAIVLILSPFLYGQWDKTKPADNRAYDLRDDDIRANQTALESALDNEHDFSGTTAATQTGFHRAGSAVAQVAATLAAERPDGTAFDANDTGRLGINTDTRTLSWYDHDTTSWLDVISDINDNATNGDTDEVWSADKIYDQLALKTTIQRGYMSDLVRNFEGDTILAMRCVYFNGHNGIERKVGLADNTAAASARVVGVTQADIANNAVGYAVTHGYYSFTADNSTDYSAGDEVWLGTDGNMVTTPPYGEWIVKVADVIDVTAGVVQLYVDIKAPLPPGERLLAGATVGMQGADGAQTVYTVPTGYSAVVTQVVVRNPTASLADGVDYDFGDGANRDSWKQTVDLSTMTSTAHYYIVRNDGVAITVFDAADTFGLKPITGSTADADATVEVFGYEF